MRQRLSGALQADVSGPIIEQRSADQGLDGPAPVMQLQAAMSHSSSRQDQNFARAHDAQATAQSAATSLSAVARKRAASRASTGSIDLGSRKRPARRNSFVTPRTTKFVSPLVGHALAKVRLKDACLRLCSGSAT